ncbi:MAG: M48 family metalloprotease, partial [Gemmatimonadota bacterium]
PRGPAADADLLPGDQILAVAGSPVTRIEDVQARAAERTPGVPLSLRVFRGGQQHRVVVVPRLRARAIDVVVTDQPWVVNAFARRDGVFVPTGILQLLPTDHELAVVIGHELAHLVRGHLAASYRTARGAAFSRDLEREADRVGLELAHRAGYHPAAGVNLWSTLARVRGAFTREWLSSHPGYAERRRTAAAIARRLRSEQILRAVLPRLPLLPVTSTAP